MTDHTPALPHCRFCAAPLRQTFVDLGMSPLCESYLSADQLNHMEPFYRRFGFDLIQSDVGLRFATERWFVGRLVGGALLVEDGRVTEPIPWMGAEPDRPGLWFGLADIDRGCFPVGSVKELAPAGSGLSADEIRRYLSALADRTAHAP